MKICSYVHPVSTFTPCTGLGRHINNMVLGLDQSENVSQNLLVARKWIEAGGRLNKKSPLYKIPTKSFPFPERIIEHSWKIMGLPYMDKWVDDSVDWVYCPAQTFLPFKKKKTAVTIHDIEAFETNLPWSNTKAHRHFRRKWSIWMGKVIKHTDLVFTVSDFTKNRMIKLLNAPAKKIKVIGNGVNTEIFTNNQPGPSRFDFPYVLVIGGLRERKGAPTILKIAKQLETAKSDLRIVVVGQNHEPYFSAATSLKNIEVLGMESDQALADLLSNAFGFLFLSYYEGFGIPVLEAMSAGIPVIASNAASLPEVVGDAGILVHPEAASEVTAQLLCWIKNPAQRKEWIERGFEQIKKYTWNNCIDNLLTAFKA